jgi:isocitrate/isopropylmalate dehydrogenase
VALRKEFDLYANVRPAVTLMPGGRYEDIDLVMIRENTEGLYVGVEHYIGIQGDPKAAAESVMIVTRFGAERIVRYAFDYAVAHGRKKVTFAHKANILKYTQGLFLDVGHEVAKEYEGRVDFEDMIIDACAMHLVMNPYRFDVLVMENMFGDIVSDLMAGLVGGLGMAPGGNIGDKTWPCSSPSTAPPPTSPARTSPTPPPRSWRPACSWTTSARTTWPTAGSAPPSTSASGSATPSPGTWGGRPRTSSRGR